MTDEQDTNGVVTSDELDKMELRLLAQLHAGVADKLLRAGLKNLLKVSTRVRPRLVRFEGEQRNAMIPE